MEQRFTGLKNQGATDYLNCTIQTFFGTPEIRKQFFFDSFASTQIGTELQKLNAKLQIFATKSQGKRIPPANTSKLTAAFGWDNTDLFVQHDALEFFHVLLDKLPEETSKLFQFVIKNGCKTEFSRPEESLNLPLNIRIDWGNKTNFKSIYESLSSYCEMEVLDGENSYYCEVCNWKGEAEKSIRIGTLPYILSFELKRFEFNFQTMLREKIHQEFDLPKKIDLSMFMDSNTKKEEVEEAKKLFESCLEKESYLTTLPFHLREIIIENITETHEYELYSVINHVGGPDGGHYFNFNKSFETQNWYKFSDSTVSYESNPSYEKTAVLAFYRKVDAKNVNKVEYQEIPENLRKKYEDSIQKKEKQIV